MNNIEYDFESNLNFLTNRKLENIIKNDIVNQDKILKSKDFNTTFKYIEESLNFLYEKERTLQDIIKYSSLYLKNEINNNIKECKELLDNIESCRDEIKNNTYISINVPLISGQENVFDRNREPVPNCLLSNNMLMSAYNLEGRHYLGRFEIKQENKESCISNNFENIQIEKGYRSFYKFNGIQSTDINEVLTFEYDLPIKINRIMLSSSNCEIKIVKILSENDEIIEIHNSEKLKDESKYEEHELYTIDHFPIVNAKKITIEMKSSNYKESYVDFNEKKDLYDFWNSIDGETKPEEKKEKLYYYLFGIDELSFEYVKANEISGFISKDISIGNMKKNENIAIEATDYGFIEYSILDGTNEIPILPENLTKVVDERIFYKAQTRFAVDITKDITVKMNGNVIDITLQEAINNGNSHDIYTVSYTPILEPVINITSKKIKVKAIVRNKHNSNMRIKNIKLKKIGGSNLWIDQVS